MEHTPLPWEPLMEYIVDKDSIAIARLQDGIRLSNAEFIVKACNSHYELLDSLRSIKVDAAKAMVNEDYPRSVRYIFEVIRNTAIAALDE